MKNNYLILIVLIALGIGAFYVIQSDEFTTIKGEKSDFAVSDTNAITKVFLADKNDNKILLTRSGSSWILNDQHNVRKEAIDLLLETIKRMRVRSPVPRSAFENVVKGIASSSVKVELYFNDNKPNKVFYVGGANPEHSGTYMLMDQSSVPFLMHIEGMRGFLTPRFFTSENDWRFSGIFNYNPQKIAEVKIEYPQDEDKSFKINKDAESNFSITMLKTNETISNIKKDVAMRYFNLYKKVHYEGFEETKTEQYIDSIKTTPPVQKYTVTNFDGKSKSITVLKKPAHQGATNFEDEAIEYDLDRIYGLLDNGDFVVIQYIIFDPLKKEAQEFI